MITSIEIQDFRGIQKTKVALKPFTIIAGLNRQGKTSVLRSLEWALGADVKGSLVNTRTPNATTARVKLMTDRGLTIERSYENGAKKSRLALYRPNGESIPDGDNLLAKNYANLGFDPIRLMFMPPKEQAALIRTALATNITMTADEATMLGFTLDPNKNAKDQLEAEYQKAYDDRTGLNRVVKNLQNKAKGGSDVRVPEQSEIDVAETAVARVETEYDEALKRAAQIEAAKKNEATRKRLEGVLADLDKELQEANVFGGLSVTQIATRLEDLEKDFKATSAEESELRGTVRQLEKIIKELGDGKFPVCPISTKIACNTDVSGIKSSIVEELEAKTAVLLALFEKNKVKFAELSAFKTNVETFKRLDAKKGERDRIQATLNSLGATTVVDGSDPAELKKTLEEMRNALTQMKMSREIADTSDLEGQIVLAEEVDKRVKAIRKFIDEEVPKRLNLGLAEVEVNNEGIFFRGLPMTDECTSVQLRIASMIVRKIYPNSKLLTIDRLEVLDVDTLRQFIERTSSDKSFQVVATYVGALPDAIANLPNVKVVRMVKGEAQ